MTFDKCNSMFTLSLGVLSKGRAGLLKVFKEFEYFKDWTSSKVPSVNRKVQVEILNELLSFIMGEVNSAVGGSFIIELQVKEIDWILMDMDLMFLYLG